MILIEGSQSGWRKTCFRTNFAAICLSGLGSERTEASALIDGRVTTLALARS